MLSQIVLFGAFVGSAFAQQAITFSNTTFTTAAVVGSTWPIAFTAGNGAPVAISFGNTTYGFTIVDGLAAPGSYSWKVAVPIDVVAGNYQLALSQDGAQTIFSPTFALQIPDNMMSSTTNAPTTSLPFTAAGVGAEASAYAAAGASAGANGAGASASAYAFASATVTAIYIPAPANATMAPTDPVTYIYWEESCACHSTTTCQSSEMPTATSTTMATYLAPECGCTTTVQAPCAETVITTPVVRPAAATAAPVAPSVAPAVPMPAAPAIGSTAPAMPVAPAATSSANLPAFTGGAVVNKGLAGSSLGIFAVVAGLVVA